VSAAAKLARRAKICPRPVHCVIAHLHQDRGVADDACAGRFTELGLTLELGPEPDWVHGDFPADEEWRIAFGKFYVGLDLAAAFGQSGDRGYQRAWERLVTSWTAQVPIGLESTDTVATRGARSRNRNGSRASRPALMRCSQTASLRRPAGCAGT
jgi:Heparinase II/III N-terminus